MVELIRKHIKIKLRHFRSISDDAGIYQTLVRTASSGVHEQERNLRRLEVLESF